MDYVVELVPDRTTNNNADLSKDDLYPASFENALSLLKDFTKQNGGQVKGWFYYEGKKIVGSAVVNFSPEVADALKKQNASLLKSTKSKPYVQRALGECFDISPRKGIKIFPNSSKGAECTI